VKVLVGVPCSDTGRYSAFSESLANLVKPPGTSVRFAVGTWRHYARNQLVQWMFEEDADALLMIDDDHVFAPDLLTRLLAHDVDIVGALCLQRAEPYGPFCFTEENDGILTPLNLHDYPTDAGLVEVAAVGTGAMLVKREVFEAVHDEWESWFTIEYDSGEDMLFCRRARSEGFKIHVDLSTPVGHLTTAAVWPIQKDRWRVGIEVSGETRIARELPEPGLMRA
jgi:hypothetical protein